MTTQSQDIIERLERASGMTRINLKKLSMEYATDKTAVRRCAREHGISVQAVYYQMRRAGMKLRQGSDANSGIQARESNPNWRGGTTRRKDGYVLEYVNGKQVFQHRLVAELIIGRRLHAGECVHHRNGNKSDNRPENLQVLSSHSEHMKLHSRIAALKARASIREARND